MVDARRSDSFIMAGPPTVRRALVAILLIVGWEPHDPMVAHGLALPSSELINRRKSPALWREDLSNGQESGKDSTSNENSQKNKLIITSPPEVMAPVGGFPQLRAAIGNGADSVYLGLSAFSARARAANFDATTELPLAVQMAHDAGVKVYVALNTLVFDHELAEVQDLIQKCAAAHVDALIVQDLGVARLAQTVVSHMSAQMEIHASTQQTITSADGAAFCDDVFGTTRVVLGRELSVAEISTVAHELQQDYPHVELEAFVHGALCVSYSGQCFSSEAWGGRSANRGQCAQACRLPYGLIDNGELKELGDFSYLLSPQDLCGLDQVPKLLQANVRCLKIEGRLKDEAYVAATTRAYRNAVDQAWEDYCAKNDIVPEPSSRQRRLAEREEVSRDELAQVFSRGQDEKYNGLTPGFFEGSQHQMLVRGRSPRHRGVHIGRVAEDSTWKDGLIIKLDEGLATQLKLGDGIVVDRGLAQEEELGGAIFDVSIDDYGDSSFAVVRFSRDVERKWKTVDDRALKGIYSSSTILAPRDAHIWKTSDAAVDKKMRRLSHAEPPRPTVTVSVSGSVGSPLHVLIRDSAGRVGRGMSNGMLESAQRSGLDEKSIHKAIGTLGNTKWTVDETIDLSTLDDGLWCPVSWIKEARRQAVDDLQRQSESQSESRENSLSVDQYLEERSVVEELLNRLDAPDNEGPKKIDNSVLSVLARDYEQIDALCEMIEDGEMIDEIIVDFLEVEGMKEAVARMRQTGVRTVIASPRIIKPNESGIWRTLLRLEPDALLVRSAGLLQRMMKLGGPGTEVLVGLHGDKQKVKLPELIGDFSLNVANALTAWELLEYGCSRVTASYDLGANAITELLTTLGPQNARNVEIVVHAHMPIFHTEHCVFARFLSNGNSYLDCGHACTRHHVHLRDETGKDNLVLADLGCRNTVFSAEAQSGAHSLKEWSSAGARNFRIELVDESAEDVKVVTEGYRRVLDGTRKASELWDSLEHVKDRNGRAGGVSFGSFRNKVERRAGEIA